MAAENQELDRIALALFSDRVAAVPYQISGEQNAVWAYQKAEEFLAARAKIRSGALNPTAPPSKLADCHCPRQKPTHPHNFVSQKFAEKNGGEPAVLNRVKKFLDWAEKHPRRDENPVAYEELEWDSHTTNIARDLFPHYVTN